MAESEHASFAKACVGWMMKRPILPPIRDEAEKDSPMPSSDSDGFVTVANEILSVRIATSAIRMCAIKLANACWLMRCTA